MIRPQCERRRERDVELDHFFRDRSFAKCIEVGLGKIPLRTEFAAVNDEAPAVVVNVKVCAESSVRECHIRGRVDPCRNLHRRGICRVQRKDPVDFNWMSAISASDPLPGSRPVNVAPEIRVRLVNTKSPAASISILPPELGREAIAILSVTSPVLKKTESAPAVAAHWPTTTSTAPIRDDALMIASFGDDQSSTRCACSEMNSFGDLQSLPTTSPSPNTSAASRTLHIDRDPGAKTAKETYAAKNVHLIT